MESFQRGACASLHSHSPNDSPGVTRWKEVAEEFSLETMYFSSHFLSTTSEQVNTLKHPRLAISFLTERNSCP